MMKNSEILLYRRIGLAQAIDKFYYEPHNDAKCHRQGYERYGKYLCAVTYQTYMRYLKTEIPVGCELPERIVAGIGDMILRNANCEWEFAVLLDECRNRDKVE